MNTGSIIREYTVSVRNGNFYEQGWTTPELGDLMHLVIIVVIKFCSAHKFFATDHSYIISLTGGNFVLIALRL